MTKQLRWLMLCSAVIMLAVTGCETTGGGGQMQTTVHDTHRRMVKLDKELGESVGRLNETTATLLARVDESDQQTRMLRGLLEENQQQLNTLSREMREMRTTLYRHWGLTVSDMSSVTPVHDVVPGQVTVESPASLQQPTTQTPNQNGLQDSAPLPTGQPVTPVPEIEETATAVTPVANTQENPQVLYQEAQRSYSRDDFTTALKQFNTYLAKYPDTDENLSANAQFWKAKCLMNMEQYGDSVIAFEGLRGKFPTSTKVPFAMHNQAVSHERLGQTEQAERLMTAVIEQFPISPAADQARADLQKLRNQ
ncbi:MAG: tetratricopeptide repeat protein [Candidatus Hydrogenedentes bacterium]|nr:tetratricopeptide repeat protein [Candidatus Hydrogenedentota bacterium]